MLQSVSKAIPHNAATSSDDGTFSQKYFVYCKKK